MIGRRAAGDPEHLREQLRELRLERTRITWWRRLVRARLDLAVARTAGPQPLGGAVAARMRVQGAEVPEATELMELLHGADPMGEVSRLVELRDLDGRLGAYERSVDESLRQVGDDLVDRMAAEPERILGRPPVRVMPTITTGRGPAPAA